MINLLFAASLVLTGCVEDVGKDKTEAVVEDVKPAEHAKEEAKAAAPKGDAWAVDPAASKVNALGAKVTATHPIVFKDFKGAIFVDGGKPTGVKYTVRMETLEADHPKLTGHLKNEDFFDVAKFPTSEFISSDIKEGSDKEGMTHTVSGDLTIHGETKHVTFPANIEIADGKAKANTEFVINRQDFGITYKGKADDLIQDNVVMTIELSASK